MRHNRERKVNGWKEETDLAIDRYISSPSFISHGLFFEAIMEIRSRHIGNQERPGLPALLSSPFRGAVFLWQPASMFSSFCDDGNRAAGIIEYWGLLNYIQLPKFRMFVRRITACYLRRAASAAVFKSIPEWTGSRRCFLEKTSKSLYCWAYRIFTRST